MWKPPGLRQLSQLRSWHVRSQHEARRNALLASTALAQRRRERVEVEDFLRRLHSGPGHRWRTG
jgi:hypothetical protein